MRREWTTGEPQGMEVSLPWLWGEVSYLRDNRSVSPLRCCLMPWILPCNVNNAQSIIPFLSFSPQRILSKMSLCLHLRCQALRQSEPLASDDLLGTISLEDIRCLIPWALHVLDEESENENQFYKSAQNFPVELSAYQQQVCDEGQITNRAWSMIIQPPWVTDITTTGCYCSVIVVKGLSSAHSFGFACSNIFCCPKPIYSRMTKLIHPLPKLALM